MAMQYDILTKCVEEVRKRISFVPKVAIVLGSGLGSYGERLRLEAVVEYGSLEGFPVSTVPGHQGRFLFGYAGEVPVVCMQGRIHYYEGYSMEQVVMPVRLMRLLGAEILLVTNASGGIHPSFQPGDFMMITDHISSFVPSPLIGPNEERFGIRFPDMSHVYDVKLQQCIREAAGEEGIALKEGVYIQLSGPNFETPAEIRMCRALGADAVGMSTAVEALAANHMGMRVCGISCVSNLAAGISEIPLSDDDVKEMGKKVEPKFCALVNRALLKMKEQVML